MLQLPKQTELVMFNNGQVQFGGHKSHWFALVLNTENGRKWLENFRKKNRHLKVTVFNRHSDRRKAFKLMGRDYDRSYAAHNIPRKFAERMAVYIERKSQYDKKLKVNERLVMKDNYYYVSKMWYDSGVKYLTADSSWVGRIFAKWSDEKQKWVLV